MERYRRKLEQDNSIDNKLQEMFGFTDEMLLKEFEDASKNRAPLPIPAPPSNEFELIWSRIQEESFKEKETEHEKIIRPRFRWKRVAAIGLIACILAGGGCFVAVGKKSYFYRERPGSAVGAVYNNDSNMSMVDREEEAYALINENLGIKPLKLSYRPYEMSFGNLEINDGFARMRFEYGEQHIYFVQSKYEKTVSYKFDSDKKEGISIKNKWINQELIVDQETLSDGSICSFMSVIIDGAYYRLWGIMEKDEFLKVVSRMTF